MSTIKTFIFSLIFILALNNLSTACDFLSVNIGGNKSEIEKYFGTIEFDEEIDEADETIAFDYAERSRIAKSLQPQRLL